MTFVGLIVLVAIIVWFAKQDRQTQQEIERDRNYHEQHRLREARIEAKEEAIREQREQRAADAWDASVREWYAYRMRCVVEPEWKERTRRELDELLATAKRLADEKLERDSVRRKAVYAQVAAERAGRAEPTTEDEEDELADWEWRRTRELLPDDGREKDPVLEEAYDACRRLETFHKAEASAWFGTVSEERRREYHSVLVEYLRRTTRESFDERRRRFLEEAPDLASAIVKDDEWRARQAGRASVLSSADRIVAIVESASMTLGSAELEIFERGLESSPWLDLPSGLEALRWLRFELLSSSGTERDKPRSDLGGRSVLDVFTATGGEAVLVGRWIERLEKLYREYPDRRLGDAAD